MIAYLSGKIRKRLEKGIILDTGNVGYLVHLPAPLLEKSAEKSDAEFYIYTKVREDDISLYGFETVGELDFFKTLLNVNGIGPKLGLEILSQNPEKVKAALMSGDLLFLTKIPGIGKKTAERIVVELKGKISWEDISLSRAHGSLEQPFGEEAVQALTGLGYQKFEINRILKDMPSVISKAEDVITYFLKNV
jgi:Holliday junction DNA helicase RuvA